MTGNKLKRNKLSLATTKMAVLLYKNVAFILKIKGSPGFWLLCDWPRLIWLGVDHLSPEWHQTHQQVVHTQSLGGTQEVRCSASFQPPATNSSRFFLFPLT